MWCQALATWTKLWGKIPFYPQMLIIWDWNFSWRTLTLWKLCCILSDFRLVCYVPISTGHFNQGTLLWPFRRVLIIIHFSESSYFSNRQRKVTTEPQDVRFQYQFKYLWKSVQWQDSTLCSTRSTSNYTIWWSIWLVMRQSGQLIQQR